MANNSRKLRMGADIRKGKNRKSNGVCRKDEEGTRGSRSSIEESIGGDEVTSR